MKTVIVMGWRFLVHSYAVVNHFQCLELLKRPGLKLYHADAPYYRAEWKPAIGLLPPEQEAALRAIEPPPPGFQADALFHIAYPHFFQASPLAKRTFTWVTSEFKRVQESAIATGEKPWHALPKAKSTFIACSNWAAKGFLNSGAPKSKVVVVPCGVDTDIYHPGTPEERAETRRRLGWEGKFVVLNISAITLNKGIDLILKAVAKLAPRHPSLIASIKGSDDLYASGTWLRGNLQRLAPDEQALLQGRIAYQGGSVSVLDIARLYRAADLYISPYRAEGFNLPVLEAAACGLPILCTRGGSTEDFVDDSWCLKVDAKEVPGPYQGVQLEPDLEMLIAQLERAITDEAWRKSASAAGPIWVRERFTWKHTVDKLLKIMLPD